MSVRRWTLLARRVLRPDRPRLAEARAVVAGLADVPSAWAALAARGLVPEVTTSLSPGAYRSGRADPVTMWTPWTPGRGATDLPPTVDAAVTLASDPDAILRASAHARQACAIVRAANPRRAPPPLRIAWRVVDVGWQPKGVSLWRTALDTLTSQVAAPTLDGWRREALREAGALTRSTMDACATEVRACALGHILWRRATSEGHPLGDDPFEPLVAVWSEGYGIDRVEGDVLVLVAPGV